MGPTRIEFTTLPCIKRFEGNPILSPDDLGPSCLYVGNAAVVKYQGKYAMTFNRGYVSGECAEKRAYTVGLAFSDDGLTWAVEREVLFPEGHLLHEIGDTRMTVLDGKVYLTFMRYRRGHCGGVAVTEDFENWQILGISTPDNRNMTIFPERIGGRIARLERPFASYGRPGELFDLWGSFSPDGRHWGDADLVLGVNDVAWANGKIGPGAPPIKTHRGWLEIFHGVDTDPSRRWGTDGNWQKRYSAGLLLLDLEDPLRVIGMSEGPVLVPETSYEVGEDKKHVIFPCGAVLEEQGEVKIYYGAADKVEALATGHVDDLLAACVPCQAERRYRDFDEFQPAG